MDLYDFVFLYSDRQNLEFANKFFFSWRSAQACSSGTKNRSNVDGFLGRDGFYH